jgi:hypothetical protein
MSRDELFRLTDDGVVLDQWSVPGWQSGGGPLYSALYGAILDEVRRLGRPLKVFSPEGEELGVVRDGPTSWDNLPPGMQR